MKKYRIVYWLAAVCCLPLFTACNGFLREDPRDGTDHADAYRTLSDVYLNAVASLYNYVGGYADSQGLQGTGRGVYDLNTFTTDEAIMPTRGGDWYDGGFWQGLYLHKWGVSNDAVQATWEYLYKVVMLSNKSVEQIQMPPNCRPIWLRCVLCVPCTIIICWIYSAECRSYSLLPHL